MTAPLPPTEQRNPTSANLWQLDADAVIDLMNREEHRALEAVQAAAPLLAEVARRVSAALQAGGRTVFIGAGTSGRIASQEIAELPPTFGIQGESFAVLCIGSPEAGPAAVTQSEDDVDAVARALADLRIGAGDVVIGLAASGTTPFVRAGLRAAAEAGAWTCALANNPGAPMFADAALGVLLDTGPEVLTGSTRLKAGTAQKLALNRITTAAMVLAGHVMENHMIDLKGTNAKFRQRSIRIVSDLAHLTPAEAEQALNAAAWSVRRAVETARADAPNRPDIGERSV
jgi:N-acetylmuramic acid 6-phosphate etherase